MKLRPAGQLTQHTQQTNILSSYNSVAVSRDVLVSYNWCQIHLPCPQSVVTLPFVGNNCSQLPSLTNRRRIKVSFRYIRIVSSFFQVLEIYLIYGLFCTSSYWGISSSGPERLKLSYWKRCLDQMKRNWNQERRKKRKCRNIPYQVDSRSCRGQSSLKLKDPNYTKRNHETYQFIVGQQNFGQWYVHCECSMNI